MSYNAIHYCKLHKLPKLTLRVDTPGNVFSEAIRKKMKVEKSFWVISALYLESSKNHRFQYFVTKRETEWGYLLFLMLFFFC